VTNPAIVIRLSAPSDASVMHDVARRAFAARQPVDPPAAALSDTAADVANALRPPGFGVVAQVDGQIAGSLLVRLDEATGGRIATLRRVGVLPEYRRLGVADAMVRATLRGLADAGVSRARLLARAELPSTIQWWRVRGFMTDHAVPARDRERLGDGYVMSAFLPTPLVAATAGRMHELGVALAHRLQAGDVIIASGQLGAGKTVLAQGIGDGLGVRGPVISPTFVLSRLHRGTGLGLVHVDAYRLGSAAELEDIDAGAGLGDAVTYIEWGAGLAEGLSDERLEAHIEVDEQGARTVYFSPVGRRWRQFDWDDLARDYQEVAHV